MKKHSLNLFGAALVMACAGHAMAEDAANLSNLVPGRLEVHVKDVSPHALIPEKYAYCVPDAAEGSKPGPNKNPHISWSAGPLGTQSYAVLMYDGDVPQDFTDANKKGKTIPVKVPRKLFTHWVLVDVSPETHAIEEGVDSNGVVEGGKPVGATTYGVRGKNDYAKYFSGTFGGYDGPCPPWNDEMPHKYVFAVFALNIPHLTLPDNFDGPAAMTEIAKHTLATGVTTGMYTQNQDVLREYEGKKK